MTNKKNHALYTGVTIDLHRRVWQHKNKHFKKSFSARYNLNKLVYFETYSRIDTANYREKQIKAGSRKKKINLIETANPNWEDLSIDWYEQDIYEYG